MDLRTYLETSGRTQAEFAAAAGTTQGRISHLINIPGESPSLALAMRIERASGGCVGLNEWPAAHPRKRNVA